MTGRKVVCTERNIGESLDQLGKRLRLLRRIEGLFGKLATERIIRPIGRNNRCPSVLSELG